MVKRVTRKVTPLLGTGSDVDPSTLPEYKTVEGRLYRRGEFSGIYYPYQAETVERYTEEEWREYKRKKAIQEAKQKATKKASDHA
jgi:hypothetical protein